MDKAMRILGVIIPVLLATCFAAPVLAANIVTVTAATGGSAISNSNIASGTWTALTGPVLTENNPGGISTGTIILNAPTGFRFNAAAPVTVTVGLVSGLAAKSLTLTSPNAVVTASTITITVATASTGSTLNSLTWSGIQVMPTACTPLASANITESGSSGYNASSTNYGTLTETGSTALTFIQQPSNALINTAIAPAVTLNACGSGAALPAVTVALTTPAGATLSGTLSTTTNNTTGLATFSNLSVNLAGTYTLTATSPGLTSAISSSFIIYNPVPATTSISPASAIVGAAAFTMTVNGSNFVTTSVVYFAGTALATTYVSSTQLTATVPASLLLIAGTYNITVVNAAISGIGGGTSNAQVFTVTIPVSNFNAFESATAAGAITGVIQTRIAGSAFGLDVVAISGGVQSAGFTGTVKVELLGNTVTGIALDAQNCPTSFTLLQTVTPNPTIVGGRSTVSFAAVADAWKDVRVRISYPAAAPTLISCSSDNFAIRPNSLSVSVTDTDWQTAGITRTLANIAAAGGNVHKAGQPFTLRATAVNTAAATTANYTGTPIAVLSACGGTACTATFGTAPVVTAAVAGVINTGTATYNEVGAFALQLQDQTFANVDAADSTTAQRYISSAVVDVGRFVPDHFSLSAASIVNRADLVCPTCTFTYMGEQMNALLTLTAQASGGSTTQNYAGVLAKFNPAAAGNPLAFGAVDTAAPTYLTARLDTASAASGSFALGVANVSAPLGIFRCTAITCPANTNPNREDGPYAVLDIGIAPVDSDGVIMSAYNLDTDAVAGNDHSKIARTEVRFGRMKLSNAHGSELLSLPIVATIQYWDGTTYVTSVTDSATQFNTNPVPGGNVQTAIVNGPLAPADVVVVTPGLVTFTNGLKTFKLAAPNTTGSVDLTIVTAPAYLLPGTTARATFGVYKGANEFIYQRENY